MPSELDIKKSLSAASEHCQHQKKRLTTQRSQILSLLLENDAPSTAYQLLDQLRETYLPNAQPPNIYRALEFLLDAGLIHRLEANNTYIACDHIQCSHAHLPTQFLLCERCGAATETTMKAEQIQAMQASAKQYGFKLSERSLELHGVCKKCL